MEHEFLEPVFIDAFDVDDAWFQALSVILEKGHVYKITRGSYEGQRRLEFDFVTIRIRKPAHQIIPIIPAEGKRILLFGSLFFIISLLPFLGLGNITSRYSYFASFGFILIFGAYGRGQKLLGLRLWPMGLQERLFRPLLQMAKTFRGYSCRERPGQISEPPAEACEGTIADN